MRHFRAFVCSITIVSLAGCASASRTDEMSRNERIALAITQRSVIVQGRPILTVVRDSVDGRWMFFTDEAPWIDPEVTVTVEDIIKIDRSIEELLDLPVGWKASRAEKSHPWNRRKL